MMKSTKIIFTFHSNMAKFLIVMATTIFFIARRIEWGSFVPEHDCWLQMKFKPLIYKTMSLLLQREETKLHHYTWVQLACSQRAALPVTSTQVTRSTLEDHESRCTHLPFSPWLSWSWGVSDFFMQSGMYFSWSYSRTGWYWMSQSWNKTDCYVESVYVLFSIL